MKRLMVLSTAFFVLAVFCAPAMAAECSLSGDKGCGKGYGSGCIKGSGFRDGKSGCSKKSAQCPIAAKFIGKVHLIFDNKEALGLTDEQLKAIKALKYDFKKALITQEASTKLLQLELKQKLSWLEPDSEGAKQVIDAGFSEMVDGAKAHVDSYLKLREILTEEQRGKLCSLK